MLDKMKFFSHRMTITEILLFTLLIEKLNYSITLWMFHGHIRRENPCNKKYLIASGIPVWYSKKMCECAKKWWNSKLIMETLEDDFFVNKRKVCKDDSHEIITWEN